jgi:hypothetical protein
VLALEELMSASTQLSRRIGTPQWCERTGGVLSTAEKLQGIALSVVGTAPLALPYLRWRLAGWHRPSSPRPEPKPPTSQVCKDAHALCSTLSPPFMVNHCVRTYSFARLLAEHWSIDFDDEALFVSGMLHDISLMPDWTDRQPQERCFTIPAGRAARNLCLEAGWSEQRAYKAEAAVTLNPNVEVDRDLGIEAYLLNLGVLVDATGLRLWELHPDDLTQLLQTHPRLQMKRQIAEFVHKEADAHPGCRFHYSRRYLRFVDLVRYAPYES